jgi:hypothetical protein
MSRITIGTCAARSARSTTSSDLCCRSTARLGICAAMSIRSKSRTATTRTSTRSWTSCCTKSGGRRIGEIFLGIGGESRRHRPVLVSPKCKSMGESRSATALLRVHPAKTRDGCAALRIALACAPPARGAAEQMSWHCSFAPIGLTSQRAFGRSCHSLISRHPEARTVPNMVVRAGCGSTLRPTMWRAAQPELAKRPSEPILV